ncbi:MULTISPECIES: UDP-glucose--hexose-1-phosphate uridylyltransferase [unclassified Paenibacillus]|uniref:UDP-glucose--hexose-1-phosphate uridylyltransferase n=1 Tax=unclassified Paenibacillus TaxID=185978 RepID=UPI001AEAB9F7|nr:MULTISPECIES: UDP-glucose--hexose-1-phosphate uridylyltransferase [unclassified Paenibacillus]MBP1153412.1 UDPglucose--hexose-1-phosphate uridylyltransferase [Paenibacillus sp. PvP091]MBP1171205.1 UDPglucose--hexose-1-phosphate uridylyltransferase [Paenibacillus sp. PvR098]MBP2442233.1 UDPglucose--hexose-1-phosphate uridylyltransferase [Paenibacillus sp. PvP052]
MENNQSASGFGTPERKAAYLVERLLQFGVAQKLLEPLDVYAARNSLLDLLQIVEPHAGELKEPAAVIPVELLEPLLDYAAEAGILEENHTTLRDLLDARIMGQLLPRQSELVQRFWTEAQKEGMERATDAFYKLCIDSNYIRMDRIRKNLYWLAPTEYGDLEITVNLSKPEKDPKEIAMLKNAPQSHYPQCLLCIENIGYAGRLNHPARQNLRVIPLELMGETWYFQYSPYVYYHEHSIIFDGEHRPMQTTKLTFERLLDFVNRFPHYFIGSNADLPIVGGSILNHDHFQGGRHSFPMERAAVEENFGHPDFVEVNIGIVKWPMSVLRISSLNRGQLLKLAGMILERWKEYSDSSQDIAAYSMQGETKVPHNTVTPIARKNSVGEYELDLVLRNNRTSAEHPEGIFHPHRELHHMKKENIGLIEVMGLAVLPGRLKDELELAKGLLTGELMLDERITADPEHPLHKHTAWLQELTARYGTSMAGEKAAGVLRDEIGSKFADVLRDAGVYKRDEQGRQGFRRFLQYIGLNRTYW